MTSLSENREGLRKPLAAHTDYARFLDPQIQASNIDFMLERHGDFLIIEFKGPNEKVTLGEDILLRALAKQPRFTVLVYQYDNDKGEVLLVGPSSLQYRLVGVDRRGLNDCILSWARERGLPW